MTFGYRTTAMSNWSITEEISRLVRINQQMKMVDMHEKLLKEGYSISYTTVRNFVNKDISKTSEVYI